MEKFEQKDKNYFFADWIEGRLSDNELKDKITVNEFLVYQKLRKSFDVMEQLNTPLDDMLLNIKKNEKATTSKPSKDIKTINLYPKWAISIAASLLFFFGIYSYYNNLDTQMNTSFGEQKTIALLDGSEVILNAKSTLKYNKAKWKNKRELYLDGEAYFKVTKGSTFTVNTKNGSVTVLGTQFNVNSTTNYFNVICYEGKVRVTENNNTHILTPKMAISTINGMQKEFIINQTAPEWTNGESTFNNVPLKFVINELEKQFNITFDRTAINQQINFSGSFNNKKLNIALATVFKPMKINYKIQGKKIILSKTIKN